MDGSEKNVQNPTDSLFVFPVLSPGGELLLVACRDLNGPGTRQAAGHVLERHARVAQVGILKGEHLNREE